MTDGSNKLSQLDKTLWLPIAVGVIALGVGFAGGYYAKSSPSSSSKTVANNAPGGGGANFGGGDSFAGARRTIVAGSVSTISSTSITITNSRTNQSQAFSITSATTVTDNGTASTTAAITVGTQVVIFPDSSNSAQAARIMIGSFGGGPFSGSGTNGNGT